jgi:hypothetical protein
VLAESPAKTTNGAVKTLRQSASIIPYFCRYLKGDSSVSVTCMGGGSLFRTSDAVKGCGVTPTM